MELTARKIADGIAWYLWDAEVSESEAMTKGELGAGCVEYMVTIADRDAHVFIDWDPKRPGRIDVTAIDDAWEEHRVIIPTTCDWFDAGEWCAKAARYALAVRPDEA